MRLAVSSYSYMGYLESGKADYFAICSHAKNTGFEAIEFIPLDLKYGNGHTDISALAAAIKKHCDTINLEVCAYTVPADFMLGSGGDIDKEVQRLKQHIDVAALLGAKLLRHDIATRLTPSSRSYRDVINACTSRIREVSDYAAQKGIRTCMENHGYLMQDAQRVEELILAVNHPNFGWLVDMGNFACADQDSAFAVGIAAPYAFHVHAKDFLIKSGNCIDPGTGWFRSRAGNYLRGTIVGHGSIPVSQCVAVLKKAGYDGFLSLEFEGMESTIPAIEAGYAYLKRFA